MAVRTFRVRTSTTAWEEYLTSLAAIGCQVGPHSDQVDDSDLRGRSADPRTAEVSLAWVDISCAFIHPAQDVKRVELARASAKVQEVGEVRM